LYSVGSTAANPDLVIGGMQDNGTRMREGTTTVFRQVIGGDGFGSNIHRTNAQLMLGSLYNLAIRKSSNGGSSFTSSTSGIAEANDETNAPFITRIVAWEGQGSTGNEVFTFSNSKIYRSTNYGTSWASIGTVTTTGALRNIAIAAGHSEIVGAVGTTGRVFLSRDGGAHFTMVASGQFPDDATALPGCKLSLSAIHFDVSDPNIVYVASVAPDSAATHLWKSTDFGAHWSAIDGHGLPAGVPVNIIKSDPNPDAAATAKVLYAGTDFGVYRSTDGASSWSRFGAGMPLVAVWDLYISPDGALVRAASYGRGFWELTNQAPPAPNRDFDLAVEPALLEVAPSAIADGMVHTQVTLGSPQDVTITVQGVPAGVFATINPPALRAGADSKLTIQTGVMAVPGTYMLTVTAAGEAVNHSKTIALHITGNPPSGSGGGTMDSGGCGCSVGAQSPEPPFAALLLLALAALLRRRE
jgi:MYXO-CTERM domain-containing protein